MASTVSFTAIHGLPFPSSSCRRSHGLSSSEAECSAVKVAPLIFSALSIKRWASTRSPITGTKILSSLPCLESMENSRMILFSSPHNSVPPVTCTISLMVICSINFISFRTKRINTNKIICIYPLPMGCHKYLMLYLTATSLLFQVFLFSGFSSGFMLPVIFPQKPASHR